jgi:hypothetical protein
MSQKANPVNRILHYYEAAFPVDAAARREAKLDFARFHRAALAFGAPGLKWSFTGCLLCTKTTRPSAPIRILVTSPSVLARTAGCPLAAVLCNEHHAAIQADPQGQQHLTQRALNRLARSRQHR